MILNNQFPFYFCTRGQSKAQYLNHRQYVEAHPEIFE
jgi:hypothetical protein